MGLRCLLGHDFGEPELEREREESGEEMVVTIREVKTCVRCGETQVVSENKEVTAVPGAEAAHDDDPADEFEAETELTGDTIDEQFDENDEFEPPQSAEEDDGIILDDEDDDPEPEPERERQPGEWPEANVGAEDDDRMPTVEELEGDEGIENGESVEEDEAEDDPSPWPEVAGEDEGFDAEPSDGSATDVTFGGLAPERSDYDTEYPDRDGYDAEFISNGNGQLNGASDTAEGFTRAESAVELETRSEDVPTEYACPECGLARPANGSSLRAGDICPECRRGYITERER
ncbi:hypothetical protein AUR64_06425 [Haloprofundus marisrubri]|uniref:Uncharacterized protein n=1 Tax=Haloprofundus marisrubri TaxID=1514971 RepID=A0A0W1RBR8_9EURY|nr:hypothetical protein [Haloprofundus marisrubri]KTG10822.1 hypothetical protein AUR64_06425 [Haloprofundus marisrubri]